MPADFSRKRSTLQHHAYVELKQGAVLLDSDFNESGALFDRASRALASGILGRVAVSQTTPDAFRITHPGGVLLIGKGRMYVDGLLAENHGAPSSAPIFDDLLAEPSFSGSVDYLAQPFLPEPPELPTAGRHLVYLDVWQREVTHLERPDLIEIAVGVETSSRVQTAWQVRVFEKDVGGATCGTPDGELPGWSAFIAPSSGVLTTGTFEVLAVDDPCELPPTGGYRGLENQLYRVEIHDAGQPGPGGATFKWSREGGSVCSAVASIVSPTELELASLGRDDVLGFKSNDWVEILDDARELSQRPGEIRRITVVEGTRLVRFEKPLPADLLPGSLPNSVFPRERHFRIRLWNQSGPVLRTDPSGTPVQIQNLDDVGSKGVVGVPAPGTAVLLEDGVTVSFDSISNGGLSPGFKTGDYWLFAARTADASVELLDRAPPRGPHHHFARLAMWDAASGDLSDCRVQWPPPRGDGHDCSCEACVTAESHSLDKLAIQKAVDRVREKGGTICLGPGDYRLDTPVIVRKAHSLSIRGHGSATRLLSSGSAFILEDCDAVGIEKLTIESTGIQPAINARHTADLLLQDLDILVRSDTGSAIGLEGVVVGATIRRNSISAPIGIQANNPVPSSGAPQSFLLIGALHIEDNLLSCRHQGIALAEDGIQMLSTRLAGNRIVDCNEFAIRALGIGVRDSSLTITGNQLNVSGDGIQCSADGAWIENNKVVRSDVAAKGRVGIGLVAGLSPLGTARCQILANQVSGFAHAGIEVSAPIRDLIIKLNVIEDCGNGILSTAKAGTSSVSIENNHLRNIGSGENAGAEVLGILVAHADTAAISSNSIQGLAIRSSAALLRAGILTIGVRRSTVSNNDVSDIAPFEDTGAGIMLLAPYAQFSVHQNRVERDPLPADQPLIGEWFALVTAGISDPNTGVAHTGAFATIAVDARTIVLGAGRPTVSTFTAAAGKPESPRGSVLGNVLNARSGDSTPAVRVIAAEECLFNDNRVELLGDSSFAVELVSGVAIVNANRVLGGKTNSIDIERARSAAVVGNITSMGILVDHVALKSPWKQLNIPDLSF